jgi:hypothetical protein
MVYLKYHETTEAVSSATEKPGALTKQIKEAQVYIRLPVVYI